MAAQKSEPHEEGKESTNSAMPHIAVIVETSTSFGRRVIRGIGRYARENGPWSVYLEQRSIFDAPPGWLKSWQGQGIICNLATPELDRVTRRLEIPFVDLSNPNDDQAAPQVLNDDIAVGRMAAEYLLNNGFRRCGFVGHTGVYWSDLRLEGFQQAITQAGGSCDVFHPGGHPRRRFGLRSWEAELKEMAKWLSELEHPVGLMAATDFRALQILDACREGGIAVPEQAAVLGVDDEEVAHEAAQPSLSSVIPNAELIGYRAAEVLNGLMNGVSPTQHQQLIEPVGVVTRQSTSLLAIQDTFVATAMQFIRLNACSGINVNDVLKHMRMSRTALQQRFLKQTNRTIHDEIIAVRITRIQELLARTDLSLPQIADRVGINDTPYLSVLFKKHTGITLSDYRRQQQGYHTS